jgi:hypothetical protein
MPIISVTRAPRVTPRPRPRPLPQDIVDYRHRYTLVQRVHYLIIITEGEWPAKIEKKTGIKPRTQRAIRKKAEDRGYNPNKNPRILESYIINNIRPGRPRVFSKNQTETLFSIIRVNRADKEKSSKVLAYKLDISYSSILRIVKNKLY